ncbi:MAG: DNA double-strand break repair nuclease NurA [Nanoarchaeota archaeon]
MKELVDFLSKNLVAEKKEPEKNINQELFHYWKKVSQENSFLFIDGGNLALFESSGIAVHVIRVAAVLYDREQRKRVFKKEFYSCVFAKSSGFETRTFPAQAYCNFSIGLHDQELALPGKKVDISSINPLMRRLAELSFCRELLSKAGCIVLDGSLETAYNKEKELMILLKEEAARQGKAVFALSKTMKMLGERREFLQQLRKQEGTWAYPLRSPESYKTWIIRLHKKAKYLFRLDSCSDAIDETLSTLEMLSKDPVFPGYPYSLILADRLARVSKQEAGMLRTQFMARMKGKWKDLELEEKEINAHAVLDRIS